MMEFEVNEFKVNEYITLRLEGSRTNIYINNEFFNQCKKLIVEIPPYENAKIHDIESIDDVEELNSFYGQREPISPDIEFWGHCSNLQAWEEHDYDTRLLHRNLAFPLLRRLVKAGDIKARKVYKDELLKHIAIGNPNVITFLTTNGFLDDLNEEELKSIIENYPKIINQNPVLCSTLDKLKDPKSKFFIKSCLFNNLRYGPFKNFIYIMDNLLPRFNKDEMDLLLLMCENDENSKFIDFILKQKKLDEKVWEGEAIYNWDWVLERKKYLYLDENELFKDLNNLNFKLGNLNQDTSSWLKNLRNLEDKNLIMKECKRIWSEFLNFYDEKFKQIESTLNKQESPHNAAEIKFIQNMVEIIKLSLIRLKGALQALVLEIDKELGKNMEFELILNDVMRGIEKIEKFGFYSDRIIFLQRRIFSTSKNEETKERLKKMLHELVYYHRL